MIVPPLIRGARLPSAQRFRLLPPVVPAVWTIGPLGSPGTGSVVLYWWPDEGWQLGRVSRPAARRPFTHVVTYRRPSAALDTLLDSASYGHRWVLLHPDRA